MNDPNQHWLLRKENIRKLWIIFIVILIVTVVAGFFVHQHDHFGIEDSVGFFAWYGFITCVGMVVFAKLLGVFLKRPEDYYDTESKTGTGTGTDKVEVDHD
jgi:RsiW-degrading membrane proteinase PrsW (M82 family)